MDQPKFQRMLRLMFLLAGNHNLTIDQLGEKIEKSGRTVYRYIDTFREAGLVIKNNDEIYRIDRSSPFIKDISELIHFTDEEAHLLKHAIESIDETTLIKQNLKKKLYTVYEYKILAEIVVNLKDSGNVNNLIEAIMQRKQVILRNYASGNSHSVRDRIVEPFEFTTNYIQLWCYEPESQKNKLFKIARIGQVHIMDTEWQRAANHKAGFIDIFRMHDETTTPVKLKLKTRAAHLLMEEYPLSSKYLTPIDKNECEWMLQTSVCTFEGIGRFVLGLMDEIEVIEPKSFIVFLQKRIHQSLKKLKK